MAEKMTLEEVQECLKEFKIREKSPGTCKTKLLRYIRNKEIDPEGMELINARIKKLDDLIEDNKKEFQEYLKNKPSPRRGGFGDDAMDYFPYRG